MLKYVNNVKNLLVIPSLCFVKKNYKRQLSYTINMCVIPWQLFLLSTYVRQYGIIQTKVYSGK